MARVSVVKVVVDKVKAGFAALLVVAGIAAFYYFGKQALVLRVLYVAGGLIAAAAVLWTTEIGQRFFNFAKEAWAETKKVVWPSRKETLQTTAAVFGFVVVMAIFLFLVDKALEYALYDLVLGWRK